MAASVHTGSQPIVWRAWETSKYYINHPITWIVVGTAGLAASIALKVYVATAAALFVLARGILDLRIQQRNAHIIQKKTDRLTLLNQVLQKIQTQYPGDSIPEGADLKTTFRKIKLLLEPVMPILKELDLDVDQKSEETIDRISFEIFLMMVRGSLKIAIERLSRQNG